MTETVLSSRGVFQAVSWNAIGAGGSNVLAVVRSIVLARVLTAEAFGLVGLAVVVITAVNTLTNINLSAALIAKNLNEDSDRAHTVNAFWTFDVCRQTVVTFLLLALSYPAGLLMNDSRVIPILMVMAATPLLASLTNVGLVLERKAVQFGLIARHRLLSEAIGLGLTIVIALVWRNVWVLVASQLAGVVISVALSYVMHPHRPQWVLDRNALRGSIGFARSMFVIGLLTFLTTQFDNLVVGRLLGVTQLGVYLLGYRIAMLPFDIYAQVLGPVLFPAAAKLKEQTSRLLPMIRDALLTAMVFFAATSLSAALASEGLVRLLYGEKWSALPDLLEWLIWVGVLRGITHALSPFLLGLGHADLDARGKIIEVSLFVPATVFLATRYGAKGAAAAGIVSYAVALLIRFVFMTRIIPSLRSALLKSLLLPVASALAIGFAGCVAVRSGSLSAWLLAFAYGAVALGIGFFAMPRFRDYFSFLRGYARIRTAE